MKFAIHLSDEKGKLLWRASGIGSLPEACAAAVAVAECHRGKLLFVNIETAGKQRNGLRHHFGGICCESVENFPLKYVRERADVQMAEFNRQQRARSARNKFLKAHGGYEGRFFKLMFPAQPPRGVLPGDELLRHCFLRNDFDGALKRFSELTETLVVSDKTGVSA